MRKAIYCNGKAGLNILHDGIRSIAGGLLFLLLSTTANKDVVAQGGNESIRFLSEKRIDIPKGSQYRLLSLEQYVTADIPDSTYFFCIPLKFYEQIAINEDLKKKFNRNQSAGKKAVEQYILKALEKRDIANIRGLDPDSIVFIFTISSTIVEKGSKGNNIKESTFPFKLSMDTYEKSHKRNPKTSYLHYSSNSNGFTYCGDIDELFRNGFSVDSVPQDNRKKNNYINLRCSPYRNVNTRTYYIADDNQTHAMADVSYYDVAKGHTVVVSLTDFMHIFYKEIGISQEFIDHSLTIKNEIQKFAHMLNQFEHTDKDRVFYEDSKIQEQCGKILEDSTIMSGLLVRRPRRNFDYHNHVITKDMCTGSSRKISKKKFIQEKEKILNFYRAAHTQRCLEQLEKVGFPLEKFKR